jgi:serine/threonine-protein kinase RsbW
MLVVQQLPRAIDALPEMFSFLERQVSEHSVSEGTAFKLNLAAEEIFTNLVRHNVSRGDAISFEIDITDDSIRLRFVDHDVEPFDPSSVPEVDVSRPAADRQPGGLGMHLVKSIVDRVYYEYEDGDMRVTVLKKRGS